MLPNYVEVNLTCLRSKVSPLSSFVLSPVDLEWELRNR
jgi:hypothetical protein